MNWRLGSALLLLAAACHAPYTSPVAAPRGAIARPGAEVRVDGTEVDVGSLVQSPARMSLDVLVPAGGDVPAALDRARTEATAAGLQVVDVLPSQPTSFVVTIQRFSQADHGWTDRLPGYVWSRIGRDRFEDVQRSAGIVRILATGPSARGWELVRTTSQVARAVAAVHGGWIYDLYRAELHDAETFTHAIPDPRTTDVHALVRIMKVVSTRGGLGHLRSIGLWRLGLPEFYVPDVPEEVLEDAAEVALATAQTLIDTGGVTTRGVVEVDRARLASWPATAGTGRLVWRAHWMRGRSTSMPGRSSCPCRARTARIRPHSSTPCARMSAASS